MPHRVLLVENHPIAVEGLRALLARDPGLLVVADVASAPAALRLLDDEPVDLVITDVTLDGGDGIELTKSLRARDPRVPVLVISAHDEAVYAERALRAGATGYVMKTAAPDAILGAVRDALAGRLSLSAATRERLLDQYLGADSGRRPTSPVDLLTDRELEAFSLFGRGLSTVQVAETMMLSPKTVETHRVHIKRKLGLSTTNEVVRQATLWVAEQGA